MSLTVTTNIGKKHSVLEPSDLTVALPSSFSIDDTYKYLCDAIQKLDTSVVGLRPIYDTMRCATFTANNCKVYTSFNPDKIQNVEFYPPAVKMTFTDGTVTTAVAQEGDEYNPEVGMMVCIMKYIWKGNTFNNVFRKWIKADEKKKADKVAAKLAKEKEKEEKAKKIAKAQENRRRREEKQIEMQKEAYLRAMRENPPHLVAQTLTLTGRSVNAGASE